MEEVSRRRQGRLSSALAAALSAYALYWVLFIVQPQVYRVSFLLVVLVLTFLTVPAGGVRPHDAGDAGVRPQGSRMPIFDWLLILAAAVALGWPLWDFDRFIYRAAEPLTIDLVLGAVTIGLVLEATRRSTGWLLPATALAFLAYAWFGPLLAGTPLALIAHRGYGLERLIGTLYMTLEGVFGVPLDVSATYIILFTIYGAVLEQSGAGRFFIDWAMSASGRSAAAPGRSVTVAGFLLGTVSGSGVATTVTLGSVAWPVLRRAGYSAETGGAMLSAAGIGALLSPPTLGAAAFLIAEFLQISYLQVLVMATVPTLLYYLSIFLMVEADSGKAADARQTVGGSKDEGARTVDAVGIDPLPSAGAMARRYWYHFTSLVAVAVFMLAGMSAFRAVFWATLVAVGLSYVRRETALTVPRLFDVLRAGGLDVLAVAATTATAGIIVGIVTLTGLGLEIAGVIVALAGGTLVLTAIYSAIAVWLLGLAVPVTASYIIAAVMVAPALVTAGVPAIAAHMFIFYYAVLSEVSPPTALSPFAAAALTGGNPFKTMVQTWKYTLPAFLVPFVFTTGPDGTGVLLQGALATSMVAIASAIGGIAAIAVAAGGWMKGRVHLAARIALALSAATLLWGTPPWRLAGATSAVVVLILHFSRRSPSGGPVDGE